MKDYSKYIKNEYGFITNIETNIEDNVIEVTTSKNKKGNPHIYKLNKENITKLYNRLEKQYNLLIDNKEEILNNITEEIGNKFQWMSYIGLIMIFGSIFTFSMSILVTLMTLATSISFIISPLVIKSKKQKSFNSMIETYKYYLDNRKEIESLVKLDENITNEVDNNTYNQLIDSQVLAEEKLTEEIFSIQFMDKISLKELKELITRYQISKALEEEQYFYTEEKEDTTSKRKTRKK